MFFTSDWGNNLLIDYFLKSYSMLHTLGSRLPNLQKIDNLATRVNLLTTSANLIPNVGSRVLQKGPGERGDLPANFRDIFYVVFRFTKKLSSRRA